MCNATSMSWSLQHLAGHLTQSGSKKTRVPHSATSYIPRPMSWSQQALGWTPDLSRSTKTQVCHPATRYALNYTRTSIIQCLHLCNLWLDIGLKSGSKKTQVAHSATSSVPTLMSWSQQAFAGLQTQSRSKAQVRRSPTSSIPTLLS